MRTSYCTPFEVSGTIPNELLDAAYKQMAGDDAQEAEALEWAEATFGDVADEW